MLCDAKADTKDELLVMTPPCECKTHKAIMTRIASWLECRTCDRKVASSNPGRSGGRILFSRVTFVC